MWFWTRGWSLLLAITLPVHSPTCRDLYVPHCSWLAPTHQRNTSTSNGSNQTSPGTCTLLTFVVHPLWHRWQGLAGSAQPKHFPPISKTSSQMLWPLPSNSCGIMNTLPPETTTTVENTPSISCVPLHAAQETKEHSPNFSELAPDLIDGQPEWEGANSGHKMSAQSIAIFGSMEGLFRSTWQLGTPDPHSHQPVN